MSKPKPTYDVFLSYSPQDATFAADTARILQSFDLVVFDKKALPANGRLEDAVWEAMAESLALVAVISTGGPSATTLFELGAAGGWNKPVYVVVADPVSTHLPEFLHRFPVYPPSRIEDVARAIKGSAEVLTDAEKSILIEEYLRIGEPVDQLVMRPATLSKLANLFTRRAKRQIAPEELVRNLLHLRKRGELPAVSKKA
jgi:hypothetical protein